MDNLVQDASMEELKKSYENADVIKSSDASDDLAGGGNARESAPCTARY